MQKKKSLTKHTISAFYKVFILWYQWWDSNPHGFPPDFESGASASSATLACIW